MINSFKIFTVFEKRLEMTILKCLSGGLDCPDNLGWTLGKHSEILSNQTSNDFEPGQNRWQQTNGSTLQKQNNPEQSLIQICYQHLSYSLKLAVKKCIIEYYIKQHDMLIIWSKYFQNMKVNN